MARTRYGVVVVAVMALAAVSVVRFVGGSEAATTTDEALPTSAEQAAPAPPPVVTVDADPAGVVPWDRPLTLRVADGTLTGVSAVDGQGQALPGDLTPDGAGWQSSGTLVPETAYTVEVTAAGTDRRPSELSLTVTASAPPALRKAVLSPADGEAVGIGMPAVVTFNRPVAKADRPAVEQRLKVTTNPPVEGDWRWITPARLHWRPA